jgi:hypothetical protein
MKLINSKAICASFAEMIYVKKQEELRCKFFSKKTGERQFSTMQLSEHATTILE